jgi:glycosyltransferase involved in cell wall biosynthesis
MKRKFEGIEFIVGIPSYMEADLIPFVTKHVDLGITKYFGDLKSIIINVDNNSEDNTKGAFLATTTLTPKHYITTPKDVRGKGNNFLNLFRFAEKHADTLKAVVVVDADLRSIKPEWIKYLGYPILKGYDYALPKYTRHQFDGTITNHICYPILYGMMGEDIRQPIGGEFGFSVPLMRYWLKKKWDFNVKQYGIDIFMTLHALLANFKICEVGLGTKVHKASSPKIGPMFTQVVTTFFDLLLTEKTCWIGIPRKKPKRKRQFGIKTLVAPQELKIDIIALKKKLRDEYFQRKGLLKKYLSDYTHVSFQAMFEQDYYNMDILMWTQVVYQLLFTYHMGSKKVKQEVIEALKPLYFARAVTFDYKTWRYDEKYVEKLIFAQAMAFASQRPYFLGLNLLQTMKGRAAKGISVIRSAGN